jgi:hypothetical protein
VAKKLRGTLIMMKQRFAITAQIDIKLISFVSLRLCGEKIMGHFTL